MAFTCSYLMPILNDRYESAWPDYDAVLKFSRRLEEAKLPECAQGDCPKGVQLPESLAFWLPRSYIQLSAVILHV